MSKKREEKPKLNNKIRGYAIASVAVILLLTVGVSLVSFLQGNMKVNYKQVKFTDPLEFTYPIDKVAVDDTGVKLVAAASLPQPVEILMLDEVQLGQGERMVSFVQSPENASVKFQISFDPNSWYYFDGGKWKSAGNCADCGNIASEVNQNLETLPASSTNLRVKALISGGNVDKNVLLHDITIGTQKVPSPSNVLGNSDSGSGKVTVCHVPPGNPSNAQEISVSINGWDDGHGVDHNTHDDDFIVDSSHSCPPVNQKVVPILECVVKNSNTSYTAKFGYNNPNTSNKTVAIGSDNKFSPSPYDRGQPTTFQPGRKVAVFSVNFDGSELKWKLEGTYAIASSLSQRCNNPPIAQGDTATTNKNTSVVIDVLANDTDPEGALNTNSVAITVAPAHGTATFSILTHKVTYVPASGYVGNDTFTYKVCDTQGLCATAVVAITVKAPANQPPVAQNDTATTVKNTAVVIDELANDSDPESALNTNSVAITIAPAHGTASVSSSTHKITYTPTSTYVGTDTITYKVCDVPGLCSTAVITITVTAPPNQPPVANNDAATTSQGTNVTIAVLTNDSDPEGALNVNSVAITVNPSHGSVSINGAHQVIYDPSGSYTGTDTFKYKVCDSQGLCDDATVTVTIQSSHSNQTPVAVDDTATTTQNTAIVINVLANDTDPDGTLSDDTLTVTVQPGHGTAVVNNTTHKITYTPATGFTGTDTFTYKICDCNGGCDTAVVTVLVMPPANQAPVANNDSATTPQNTAILINVLVNDNDPENALNVNSLVVTAAPAHGTAVVDSVTHKINYTPTTGFNGTDQFTYKVCDNGGLCATAIVTITVTPPANQPPVAQNDNATTQQNTPVDINVLVNDSDPESALNPNSVMVTVNPGHGSAVVNPTTHQITYTPTTGFTGTDVFTYKVCDVPGLCATATVTVTVQQPPNQPPVADDDTAVTGQDTPVSITVLTNDSDPEGALDLSSVAIVTPPIHGTAVVNPTTHQVLYTPTTGYFGTDTFTYKVCDVPGLCDNANVNITITEAPHINQPPVALDDVETTQQEISVNIDILGNDTDPEGSLNVNSVAITVAPAHGTATVNAGTHQIDYTPAVGYSGTDTFTYKVCDTDGLCDTAVVTITISATPNNPPVAQNDTAITEQNTPVAISVLINDADPEGQLNLSSLNITNPASHGNALIDTNTHQIVYTPNSGFVGNDSFDYQICDNQGLCAVAHVTVTVNAPANQPPVANDDSVSTQESTLVSINVLNNDSDPEGNLDVSTVSITIPPTHGTASVNAITHKIDYTPNAGFVGGDSLSYQVCDVQGACDSANVLITITAAPPVNQPPVAQNDTSVTSQDTAVDITVLTNDTDPEGFLNASSLSIVTNPANGSVTVNPTTHQIHYTPNFSFSGSDTFSYQICDIPGLCTTATVTVTVTPAEHINEPPVALDDSASVNQDSSVSIGVLGNDSDPEGSLNIGSLTVTANPLHGSAIVNATTHHIDYTPNPGYSGNDTFTYQICDSEGLCDTATVTVSVVPLPPVNQPPVAQSDTAETYEDNAVDITVLGNDYDPEDHLNVNSLTVTTPPAHGTATVNPLTHQIVYTPAPGYSGSDSFVYQICDDEGLCSNASVIISILTLPPVNQPPIAVNDTAATQFNTLVTVDVLANDTDPEGSLNLSSLSLINAPSHGLAVVDTVAHNFTYTPDLGFSGTDTFTYEICDTDGLCDTAQVTVTVAAAPNLPPELQSDSSVTNKNTPVEIDVLLNDSDPDGSLVPSTLTITVDPAHGTVTIDSLTHKVTYTPTTGYIGTDSFVYQVCDNEGACATASVSIMVMDVHENQPPIAQDDMTTTNEDQPVTIQILNNDTDPEGSLDSSSVSLTQLPAHGTTVFNSLTHEFEYSPTSGFSGVDSFKYQVCDSDGLCDDATVTITVVPAPNLPPTVLNDNAVTIQDTPVTISVLSNDSDTDGTINPVCLALANPPAHGSVTIDSLTHQMIYTPSAGYIGVDTFAYTVCDNEGLTGTASVTVNVSEAPHVPEPPVAGADIALTSENEPVSISILGNDTDPEGALDLDSIEIVVNPAHGTAVVNPTTHTVDYTPATGFSGFDSFNYQICDADSLCATASVLVIVEADAPVNQSPIALDDSASLMQDTHVDINVLENDSDPEGSLDLNSLQVTANPSHGTVVINPTTHEITYTPTTGYVGNDQFTYKICDTDGLCDFANVNITVVEVNNPVLVPPDAVNDSVILNQDTTVNVSVLLNDSDSDGTLVPSTLAINVSPQHGTASVNNTTNQIVYTPETGFSGSDNIIYQICDNDSLCSSAAVILTINSVTVPNLPPVAQNDVAATTTATPVVVSVLLNDSDPEGSLNATSLNITQVPDHGTASVDAVSHTISYNPGDYVGTAKFSYSVCDTPGLCDTAEVTVSVSAAPNQPPVAASDASVTLVNTPITITVLPNDTDPEGQLNSGSLSLITPPAHGGATINTIAHTVVYTPTTGYTGLDTLVYQVCDLQGLCAVASVNITVFPIVNQPPVANDDSGVGAFNSNININLLGNDSDPDDILQPNLLSLLTQPQHGTGSINTTTGVFTFVPTSGFVGNDTATYRLCDTDGACDTATIFLSTLSTTNIPPLATDDVTEVTSGLPSEISVLVNDSDPDGFLVNSTVTIQTAPSFGVYAINAVTGVITYTSNSGYVGNDSFSYEVCDNSGACDTAIVNISVVSTPVIVPPIDVIPPEEPTGPLAATVNILQTQCDRTYTTNTLTFTGATTFTANAVSQLQYSINGGQTWNRVSNEPAFTGTGGNYSLGLQELGSGDYTLQVRAVGATSGVAVSNLCKFTVASGLVLGANEFILANQSSPVSDKGVIEFVAGQEQTLYIEGQGATNGEVRNLGTGEVLGLTYDNKLHLWTGKLVFKQAGIYKLEVKLSNKLGEIKREINTIFVSPSSSIVDDATGKALNQVTLSFYRLDSDTGNFALWNSQTFNQSNPINVNGSVAVGLPNGQYYMTAERDGYSAATSRIFSIARQSVVSFQIRLQPLSTIFDQVFNAGGFNGDRFQIITSVLPQDQKLVVDQPLPDTLLTAEDKTTTQKLSEVLKGKQTVTIVFSGWNTLAQQQLQIFDAVAGQLADKFKFVAITTMEPLTASGHYITRGQYNFSIFKPADDFYEKFGINSLPQIIITDAEGKLIQTNVGNISQNTLNTLLQSIN